MQSVALILAGVLFIASTGLLFNDRFRTNRKMVVTAGLLAIMSTISFVYGCLPKRTPSAVATAPTDPLADQPLALEANEMATMMEDGASETRHCNWEAGETITACIKRLRRNYSEDQANYFAFLERAERYKAAGSYRDAVDDYTVAIQNSGEAATTYLHLLRGVARLNDSDFVGALRDCNVVADPRNPLALADGRVVAAAQAGFTEMLNACRGVALSRLGKHREALPPLDLAIAAGDATWHMYLARSQSRKETGDSAGAASDYRIAGSIMSDGLAGIFEAASNASQSNSAR